MSLYKKADKKIKKLAREFIKQIKKGLFKKTCLYDDYY